MSFHAYLLRCADGRYSAGSTDDLARRLAEHASGAFPGFTSGRRPIELVWSDAFPTREEAFRVERQVKGWTRAKKEALIRGDWTAVRNEARRRSPDRHEGGHSGAGRSSFESVRCAHFPQDER